MLAVVQKVADRRRHDVRTLQHAAQLRRLAEAAERDQRQRGHRPQRQQPFVEAARHALMLPVDQQQLGDRTRRQHIQQRLRQRRRAAAAVVQPGQRVTLHRQRQHRHQRLRAQRLGQFGGQMRVVVQQRVDADALGAGLHRTHAVFDAAHAAGVDQRRRQATTTNAVEQRQVGATAVRVAVDALQQDLVDAPAVEVLGDHLGPPERPVAAVADRLHRPAVLDGDDADQSLLKHDTAPRSRCSAACARRAGSSRDGTAGRPPCRAAPRR